jgi:hypothetical protein
MERRLLSGKLLIPALRGLSGREGRFAERFPTARLAVLPA